VTRVHAWLAAALVVVAGLAVPVSLAPAAQAASGMCTTKSGVSVVVDDAGLGGGVAEVCDTSGTSNAQQLFAAHHAMTYTQRYPGVVCKIDGKGNSACVNMPPADAYWGLWWSDGTDGQWHYSTVGVGSLSVPQGGSVAFAWQGSSSETPPSVAPARPTASPSPKPTAGPTSSHPTTHPTRTAPTGHTNPPASGHPGTTGSKGSTTGSGNGSPTGTTGGSTARTTAPNTAAGSSGPAARSGSGTPKARATHRATRSASSSADPSASPTTSASPGASSSAPGAATTSTTATPTDTSGGGVPGWLAPALVGLVVLAGGGVALARRRRG